jgi:hypothetical protein
VYFLHAYRIDTNWVRIFTKGEKQLGERLQKPLAINAVYISFTKEIGLELKEGIVIFIFLGRQ